MIELLAQATQPAWKNWGPVEWTAVIGSITASIVAIIGAFKALRDSTQARTNSAQNAVAVQKVADAVDPNVATAQPPGLSQQVRELTKDAADDAK